MDVKFNGIWLSTFAIIMDYRKDIIPPREWSSYQIPGRAGAYLGKKTIEPRLFEIDLKFVGDIEEKRKALGAILETDGPAPLIFESQPNIIFNAVFTGESELEPESHTADVTISFFVADPYGIGDPGQKIIENPGTTNVYVNGDAETFPVIRAEFQSDGTFFSIANDEEDFILIGEPPSVDDVVLPYEELILWDQLDTTTGWIKWGGVPDNGANNGTMRSDGTRFELDDPGTGNEWHGAAVVKTLPEPLTDFLVDFTATQRSGDVRAVGRVEFYLLDVNGQTVAKLEIRDGDLYSYINSGYARLGTGQKQRYIINHKTRNFNAFQEGHLRLRRDGRVFSAYIARHDPETNEIAYGKVGRYYDFDSSYQNPIAQVVISIAAYRDQPFTWSYADDIRIYKLNQPPDPWNTVDQLFKTGDILEINTATGAVMINGQPTYGKLNPQSNFFNLRPGSNEIGIATDAAMRTEITYSTRWN